MRTGAIEPAAEREVSAQRGAEEVALDGPTARARLGEEGALLAETAEAFRARYGAPLVAVSVPGDPLPSLRFPPVALDQELLLYAPPSFREVPAMRAYLRALGFEIDARRRVSTVPLPSSFARRRARLGAEGGLRPRLLALRATLYTAGAWLEHLERGILPINVHGGIARALLALARALPGGPAGSMGGARLPRPMQEKMNNHFHALGHDMGLHALALHRIPEAPMRELRRLARAALRRGWIGPGALGARARVARFFEERLTRSCVEVWAACERPEAFAPLFGERYPILLEELREAALGHG